MHHPTGRKYTEYEMSLIDGTITVKHKPQSLIEIYHSAIGSRIVHQPRGNMERLREKQRKSNGSNRGLFSVIALPESFDGKKLYDVLSHLDGAEVQYQPHDGADNYWNVSLITTVEPEKVHHYINQALPPQNDKLELDDKAIIEAPRIKGIF